LHDPVKTSRNQPRIVPAMSLGCQRVVSTVVAALVVLSIARGLSAARVPESFPAVIDVEPARAPGNHPGGVVELDILIET
jgi:hypothetical protein